MKENRPYQTPPHITNSRPKHHDQNFKCWSNSPRGSRTHAALTHMTVSPQRPLIIPDHVNFKNGTVNYET